MASKVFDSHVKFAGRYIQPVAQQPVAPHRRPTSGDQKLPYLEHVTESIRSCVLFYCSCELLVCRTLRWHRSCTDPNGKFKVDYKAQPGTTGFETADWTYQDLFAHTIIVSPVETRQIYLTMADVSQTELSWVLEKFYMVNHTRTDCC